MARAILTDAERLAWECFPADPDPEVVGAFFTLVDGEVDALRRLPTPAARLATAVALATIRWLGFVPVELDQAPAAGAERLAGQLDVDPSALDGYAPADRTAREHRQRAAQLALDADPFWRLVAAFLVECRREQTRRAYLNDLRAWYAWCVDRELHPLAAHRHDVAFWARQLANPPQRSGKTEAPASIARPGRRR